MRILGIDPGTRVVGFGVIEAAGSRLSLVDAGVFAPGKALPLAERLARIASDLEALLARHRPEAAAVEDVFVKSDPRAALAIGHGRGAILAVLGAGGLTVHDYPPATVKRAVTGNGRADKGQVARMVGILLGSSMGAAPADATDALAVAIAHAAAARTQVLTQQEVKRPQAR